MPAHVSRTTSRTAPVREGMKLWCHSSRLATSAVIKNEILAHCMDQAKGLAKGSVARQARNKSKLRVK